MHQLYKLLLRSGLALGAGRWLATLQRQCEGLAILMSSVAMPEHDSSGIENFMTHKICMGFLVLHPGNKMANVLLFPQLSHWKGNEAC